MSKAPEVFGVHGEGIWMGRVAYNLLGISNLSVSSGRPPAFDCISNKHHRATIVSGPIFHLLEDHNEIMIRCTLLSQQQQR